MAKDPSTGRKSQSCCQQAPWERFAAPAGAPVKRRSFFLRSFKCARHWSKTWRRHTLTRTRSLKSAYLKSSTLYCRLFCFWISEHLKWHHFTLQSVSIVVPQLSNIPKPQDVPWTAGRFHALSNSNSLNRFNLIELPRLNDMVFEGKSLGERSDFVDASEETLKAPSWSCNSCSSSVAKLSTGLRGENQGGRSRCASTWPTLGTQIFFVAFKP